MKTRFNIQTLGDLIKGCGLMSFWSNGYQQKWLWVDEFWVPHFQGMSKLVSCTFWHLNISRGPQKPSFNFPGKMGKGYVYKPSRVYLHNLAGLPEGEVLCIALLCSGDQNRMYFLSCHVGCWQNGNVTPCSIFQSIKFYQIMCLSKINCCVTCCNLLLMWFVVVVFLMNLFYYVYLATPPLIC